MRPADKDNRDDAAVLRTARGIIADGQTPCSAPRHDLKAGWRHALLHEALAHSLGALRGENQVLLFRAWLVSVPLDRGFEAAMLAQPSRLSSQSRTRFAA